MSLSRNQKNNVYPCKLQFYCIKMGFKGVKIIYKRIFMMCAPAHIILCACGGYESAHMVEVTFSLDPALL